MKTIDVNGVKLVDFTPQDNEPKGIVHIATIKRLAALLPKANAYAIICELMDQLHTHRTVAETNPNGEEVLNGVVHTCAEFINFHETVNLIREYKPEPAQLDAADDSH